MHTRDSFVGKATSQHTWFKFFWAAIVTLAVGVLILLSLMSWDKNPQFSALIFAGAGLGIGYLIWGMPKTGD